MKLNRNKKIIIAVCSVFIVIIIAAAILFAVLKKSDKAKLLEAAAKLVAELDQQGTYESMQQLDEIVKLYTVGEYETDINISLYTPAYPKTLTLTGEYSHNQQDKRADASCSIGVDGEKAIDANLYLDESELYIMMPDLLDAGLIVPMKEFGKKYNKSVLAKLQGNKVDENFEIDFFNRPEINMVSIADCYSIYGKSLWKIISASEVTLLEDQKTYEVSLPKELFEDLADENSITIDQDIKMLIRTDDDGNICEISNENAPIQIDSEAYQANVSFERESELKTMNLLAVGANLDVNYQYQFENQHSDLTVGFMKDEKKQTVHFAGVVNQAEKGTVKIEELSYRDGEELSWKVDGLVAVRELSHEIEEMKPKKEYRIFEMSELDMIFMITEVGVKGLAKLLMLG